MPSLNLSTNKVNYTAADEGATLNRTYTYRLRWPPSVNCYIRRGNNRSYMTKKGKEFRDASVFEILGRSIHGDRPLSGFTGRLAVHIELTAPDRRTRDIDNHVKPVLDALEHASVFVNDSQIDELRVTRLHVEPPGCCDVTITQLD